MNDGTKMTGLLLNIAGLGLGAVLIFSSLSAANGRANEIMGHWTLAERASTADKKAKHIGDFVTALNGAGLNGCHDALFYDNPSNSFDEAFRSVESLNERLKSLSGKDPAGMEYQLAMSQITGQEQGEADDMIGVIKGCWLKENAYLLWNPFSALTMLFAALALIVVGAALMTD